MTSTTDKKTKQSIVNTYRISKELYEHYNVKRGLRNQDGSGVLAGLTQISSVTGLDQNGKPAEGRLKYRGISIQALVERFDSDENDRFEKTVFFSENLEDFASF